LQRSAVGGVYTSGEKYIQHIIQVVEQGKSSCAAVATFEHVYVALPVGGVSLVPTAVMFVHCCEHTMSTTCCFSAPEEVPVTLMSAGRVRARA
jgi:hypothetical protein